MKRQWFRVYWAKQCGISYIKARDEEQAIELAESGKDIDIKDNFDGKVFVEEVVPSPEKNKNLF